MSRFTCRRLIAASAAVSTLIALTSPAVAQDQILLTVSVSGVHRRAEDTSILVAEAAVPEELIGQSCEIFGSTVNQRSVHPGNDLLIVNGDESFTIPDFEDEGDIVHDAGDVETLGATIRLFVVFGPDGASSGGFRATVRNCEAVETTTTEAPPTTSQSEPTVPVETTAPAEPTAPAETTTTEAAPETTVAEPTAVDPAGPTAEPSTTAAPTTVPPATEVPSTTTVVTTTQVPATGADPLGPTELSPYQPPARRPAGSSVSVLRSAPQALRSFGRLASH